MCLTLLSAQLSYFVFRYITTMHYQGQPLTLDPFDHTFCVIIIVYTIRDLHHVCENSNTTGSTDGAELLTLPEHPSYLPVLLMFMLPNLSFPIIIL